MRPGRTSRNSTLPHVHGSYSIEAFVETTELGEFLFHILPNVHILPKEINGVKLVLIVQCLLK